MGIYLLNRCDGSCGVGDDVRDVEIPVDVKVGRTFRPSALEGRNSFRSGGSLSEILFFVS